MTKTQDKAGVDRESAQLEAPPRATFSHPDPFRTRTPSKDLKAVTLDARLLDALCLATKTLVDAYARVQHLSKFNAASILAPPTATEIVTPARSTRHRRNRHSRASARSPRDTADAGDHNPGETLFVYCAGTPGLQQIALAQRLPVFKLGTTRGSVRTRVAELSAMKYAALADPAGDDEPGFDEWTNVRIVARPPLGRAIKIHRGFIEVRLSVALSAPAFEAKLREALVPFAIERATDVLDDSRPPLRWTRQRYSNAAPAKATELYAFRPREDGDQLVGFIEDILEKAQSSRRSSHRDGSRERSRTGLRVHELFPKQ